LPKLLVDGMTALWPDVGMRRRLIGLLMVLAVFTIIPPRATAASCVQTLVMVSPSGCTAVYCDLAYEVAELRTGRKPCYYDNCGVVYVENCP
jgi:hypothetical protein